MKQIFEWMNANRALWFFGAIGAVLGMRFGFYIAIDPNHTYTLHDLLWGYNSSNLPNLLPHIF